MFKLPVVRDRFASGFTIGFVIPVLWVVCTSVPALSSDRVDSEDDQVDQSQLAEEEGAILTSLGWDQDADEAARLKATRILEADQIVFKIGARDTGGQQQSREKISTGIEVFQEELQAGAALAATANREEDLSSAPEETLDSNIEIVVEQDQSDHDIEFQEEDTHSEVGEQLRRYESELLAEDQRVIEDLAAKNEALLASLVADYKELEREASALLELDVFYDREGDSDDATVQVAAGAEQEISGEPSDSQVYEFVGPQADTGQLANNLPLAEREVAEDVPLSEEVVF